MDSVPDECVISSWLCNIAKIGKGSTVTNTKTPSNKIDIIIIPLVHFDHMIIEMPTG